MRIHTYIPPFIHPHIYIIILFIFFVRFVFGLVWYYIVKVLLRLLFWFPIVGVWGVIYGVGLFFFIFGGDSWLSLLVVWVLLLVWRRIVLL